ncbi:MAG: orotate phosphoribosyltransferase [Myxococcales bacterium]|nr:orotate phosphoribosyltransferase [Myxococcales bacterium]
MLRRRPGPRRSSSCRRRRCRCTPARGAIRSGPQGNPTRLLVCLCTARCAAEEAPRWQASIHASLCCVNAPSPAAAGRFGSRSLGARRTPRYTSLSGGTVADATQALVDQLARHAFRFASGEPFRLASGALSRVYLDCKQVSLRPDGLRTIGVAGYAIARHLGVVAVGGLTLGADPIACAIAHHSARRAQPLAAFVVRKEPKGHGTARTVEGPLRPGSVVAVVDDVLTTGGSTIQAIHRLRAEGHFVHHAIVLVDRGAGGCAAIEAEGVCVHRMTTLHAVACAAVRLGLAPIDAVNGSEPNENVGVNRSARLQKS